MTGCTKAEYLSLTRLEIQERVAAHTSGGAGRSGGGQGLQGTDALNYMIQQGEVG